MILEAKEIFKTYTSINKELTVLDNISFQVKKGEILAIVGLSLPEAFAQLCPEADAQERLLLVEAYKDSFASLRKSASASALYPGALACLDRLKHMDDVVLGIATGKSRRGLRHVLSNPDFE